jgi:hypothetical protein
MAILWHRIGTDHGDMLALPLQGKTQAQHRADGIAIGRDMRRDQDSLSLADPLRRLPRYLHRASVSLL